MVSFLALVTLLTAAPCCEDTTRTYDPAPSLAAQGDGAIRMTEEPLQVWLDLGYGSVDQFYGEDGEVRELGLISPAGRDTTVDANGAFSFLTLHLGGQYDLLQFGAHRVQAGADVSLARWAYATEEVSLPPAATDPDSEPTLPAIERSSGFAPQNLTLFTALEAPYYTLRADYLLDLGPEISDDVDYYNSDQENALRLSVSGRYLTEVGYRFFGKFGYTFTFGEDTMTGERGGVYRLRAGAGFRPTSNVELGLALAYHVQQSDGAISRIPPIEAPADPAGRVPRFTDQRRLLTITPYLTYQAADAPFQIRLKTGFQGEYFDYGYALWGENGIAPGLGATLGITYGIL